MEELIELKGFINCCKCPMLAICKHGSCGVSRFLGKFEGLVVSEEQIPDFNRLTRIMNKLLKSCPLVIILGERDNIRSG